MNTEKVLQRLIVPPGKKISLKKDFDPALCAGLMKKSDAKQTLADGIKKLVEIQERLYAQDVYGVLIILQAMDAAGKDGTIKHVMSGLNPQGTQVYSFKAPSSEELDHSYLWRCFKALPERGRIGIFNRSYYEEVLVARVHREILSKQKLPPGSKDEGIWQRRFEEINNFEKYLVNNGIIVIKFFLNVSKEVQKQRFLQRIELPQKNWKFSVSDARERAFWDDYQKAYEACFNNTSTKWAPWYVIPADDKPAARVAVSMVILERLKQLKLDYPDVTKEQKEQLEKAKQMLLSEK